jgi:predicted nucleic acid-binding protein
LRTGIDLLSGLQRTGQTLSSRARQGAGPATHRGSRGPWDCSHQPCRSSCRSAKAVRLGAITREEGEVARRLFQAEWHDLSRIDITDLLIEWASDLAWGYGLRGYDSVQLAAALTWQAKVDVPTLVATYDVQLWQAAARVGLEPYPPDLPQLLETWKT